MEVLFYSLGVLTVAFLYAVVSVFKLRQQIKQLEIYKQETDQNVWDLSRNISDQADEIYRTLDSRLDKLEDRLTKNS